MLSSTCPSSIVPRKSIYSVEMEQALGGNRANKKNKSKKEYYRVRERFFKGSPEVLRSRGGEDV